MSRSISRAKDFFRRNQAQAMREMEGATQELREVAHTLEDLARRITEAQ